MSGLGAAVLVLGWRACHPSSSSGVVDRESVQLKIAEAPNPIHTAPPTTEPGSAAARLEINISGSNTIGSELMPQVIDDYCKRNRATKITRDENLSEQVIKIRATFDEDLEKVPGARDVLFTITAKGTGVGFDDLRDRATLGSKNKSHGSLWMASNRIEDDPTYKQPSNYVNGKPLSAYVNDFVIGFDGVTIITTSKSVKMLTFEQLRALFMRSVTTQEELRKRWPTFPAISDESAISICIRKRAGTTRDFEARLNIPSGFVDALPASAGVVEGASHDDVLAKVRDGICHIGYVSFASVAGDRDINIAKVMDEAAKTAAVAPSVSSIFERGPTGYPITRDLLLYTYRVPKRQPIEPADQVADKIVKFAADVGQLAVRRAGLVPLALPEDLQTAGGQLRSPSTLNKLYEILFPSGSYVLADDAQKDLGSWASANCNSTLKLALFGFTDVTGNATYNRGLAYLRASQIVDQLKRHKVSNNCQFTVTSFASLGAGDGLTGADKRLFRGDAGDRRVEIRDDK